MIVLSELGSAMLLATMETPDTVSKFPREFEWVNEYREDAKNVIYHADTKKTSYYVRVMEHDDFLVAMEKHIKEDIIYHYRYLRDNFPDKKYCKEYLEHKLYNTYWVDELNIDVESLIKTLDI
jgi:hypothetical protein